MRDSLAEHVQSGEIGRIAWRYEPCGSESEWRTEILSPAERDCWQRFGSPVRKREWITGRIALKRLLKERFLVNGLELAEIEIKSRDDQGKGIPPVVRAGHRERGWAMGLSHSRRGALAAVSECERIRIGVDLVDVADVRPRSLALWLSETERNALSADDPVEIGFAWAAKEAAYKALCVTEPFQPRRIEVLGLDGSWSCRWQGRPIEGLRWHRMRLEGQLAVLVEAPR